MISITGLIVIYAVLWFSCLYMILPQRVVSQAERDDVVPGTPGSAPSEPMLRGKFLTTVVAAVLWAVIVTIILSGKVHLSDWWLIQLPSSTK
jgi:predicted secreted protein